MSDDGKRRGLWWQVLVGGFALVVVYLLSPGPVGLLQQATIGDRVEWLNDIVWYGFYAPLQYLADEYAPVADFYEWYFEVLDVDL